MRTAILCGLSYGKKLTYNETFQTKTQTIRNGPTKKERLLADPDVRRWYKNVARGSQVTADINLRRLSKFCEDHQTTPKQLAEMGMRDVREVTDLLTRSHILDGKQRKRAPVHQGNHNSNQVMVASF